MTILKKGGVLKLFMIFRGVFIRWWHLKERAFIGGFTIYVYYTILYIFR